MIIRRRVRDFDTGEMVNKDIAGPPVAILTTNTAHGHTRNLPDAIPPKKEHLQFINLDRAAKHVPGFSPDFNGPINGKLASWEKPQ